MTAGPLTTDIPHAARRGRVPGDLLAIALLCAAVSFVGMTGNARAAELLDVVFVLDNSGSMRAHDPEFLTRSIVLDFAEALAEDPSVDGRIAIVLFDGKARLVQGLTPIRAASPDTALRTSLAALDFSGQRTNSPAAVERAIYELRQSGREDARRAIVFLTDGKIDTGDAQNDREVGRWLREDLASESRAAGIRIFGVAFTESADYQLMQALARRTGARYYRAFEIGELTAVVDDVLDRVTDEDFYRLATADSGPANDGREPDPAAEGASELSAFRDTPANRAEEAPLPAVSAGPRRDWTRGVGLLGLLPIALLLVAGGLLWQIRSRKRPAAIAHAGLALSTDAIEAPAAQLLDFGGQVGETGTAILLNRGRTRVGRDPHNEIRLDDETISSEHAVIELQKGRYWLEDLRSTNGTRHGERRLQPGERVALKGGDHIRFADIDLMFVLAGYLPGGATVVLNSTTSPPPEWRSQTPGGDAPDFAAERHENVLFGASAHAPRESDVVDLDAHLANELPREIDSEATDHDFLNPAAPESQRGADPQVAPDLADPAEPFQPASPPPSQSHLSLLPTPVEDAASPAANEAREVTETDAPPVDLSTNPEAETRKFVVPDFPTPPEAAVDPPVGKVQPISQTAAESAEATEPTELTPFEVLRSCLDYHLELVQDLSPAFGEFVARAFDEELRAAMAMKAGDLLEDAERIGRIAIKDYSLNRIRFVLCGVPGRMDDAKDRFVESFGGYTRLLSDQLESDSFRAAGCEVLAVLSFGRDEDAWCSLSIVPDEGQDAQIDLLSYEFLTDDERRAISPGDEQTDISQSGLR